MRRRTLLLTEIISPYRIPVFNALAQNPEIDLKVVFLADTDPGLRRWHVYKDEIRFPYQVLPSWRSRLGKHNLLLNRGVTTFLSAFAPEVILCGGYNYPASWTALRWAQQHHARFLLWTESTASDARDSKMLIERLKANFLSRCDGFVVPGSASRRYVRSFGVADDQIVIARNAVDIDFFSHRADTARSDAAAIREKLALPERYFLFVGRLVREKGVLDLVKAYGSLSSDIRQQVSLVLAGDGPLLPELENLIRSNKMSGVRLLGFVHREELPIYYGLADVFVLPTHSDVWGLVVNEAMACGLPIISTDVAGCAEDLLRDGWNGILCGVRDAFQLASAMERLAASQPLRVGMGQNSRNLIRAFSPDACAAGMAEAILTVRQATPPVQGVTLAG